MYIKAQKLQQNWTARPQSRLFRIYVHTTLYCSKRQKLPYALCINIVELAFH